MNRKSDLDNILQAIQLSIQAFEQGEAPFGALIITKSKKIIAAEYNRTNSEEDPTMHAEIAAIRAASEKFRPEQLAGSTLFCSCEPCQMCLFAAFYSNISEIIYAAEIEDAIHYGSGDPLIKARKVNDKYKLGLKISGGIYRNEAVKIFIDYSSLYGSLESKEKIERLDK